MTGIAIWGAFFADAHFFSESPINLFSEKANLHMSKTVCGFGAVVGVLLIGFILKRLFKSDEA